MESKIIELLSSKMSGNLTLEEMYNQSYYYWYPDFSKEKALEESEYLFQGKVKII